jgi:hypothetical protein
MTSGRGLDHPPLNLLTVSTSRKMHWRGVALAFSVNAPLSLNDQAQEYAPACRKKYEMTMLLPMVFPLVL